VLEISSLLIISIEARLPEANIKTASDAIWWGYVTITTVGYGDLYPVTNSGRTVGIFLLTAGVGLFGVLTGYLANAFLAPPDERETTVVTAEDVAPRDTHALVAELSTLLDEQAQANIRLKQRLTALESALLHESSM
jgi:voltage-gated potassium channel